MNTTGSLRARKAVSSSWIRGTTSRAGGTSIASPGSRKARCMSTTTSAVRPAAGASAPSKAADRSVMRYQGATEKAFGM